MEGAALRLMPNGHVVVLESDELIRELLERWLAEAGYAVHAGGADSRGGRDAPRLVIANVSSPQDAAAFIESLQALYGAWHVTRRRRTKASAGFTATKPQRQADTAANVSE